MKSMQADREVIICKTYQSLTEETTKKILEASQNAIAEKGSFHLALCGGIAARGIYSMMASKNFADQFDWDRIHLYWTDERWVAVDHAKSNYGLVAEVLLTRVDIPIENIHPIKTNADDPSASALLYEDVLRAHLGLEPSYRFDLVLLNVGHDGHIASLYPDHEATVRKESWVVPVSSDDIDEKRVTITLPLINQSKQVLFLASGKSKAEVLPKALTGSFNDHGLPVQLVRLDRGSMTWMVDSDAAEALAESKAS